MVYAIAFAVFVLSLALAAIGLAALLVAGQCSDEEQT